MSETNIFSYCRVALQTAAQAVPPFDGATNQVVIGDIDWAANKDFFGDIIDTGPWLIIRPAFGEGENAARFEGTFQVNADLVYGFLDNEDYDWREIEQIIAKLIKAWVTYSEFVQGGNVGPFRFSWQHDAPRPNPASDGKSSFIARTRFSFYFPFVLDQGAA